MKDHIKIKNIEDFNSLLLKAEDGDGEAMFEVSTYYEDGWTYDLIEIVKRDPQLAVYLAKKSFESRNIDGMVTYAYYLSDKNNAYCENDTELAMNLYRKSHSDTSSSRPIFTGYKSRP